MKEMTKRIAQELSERWEQNKFHTFGDLFAYLQKRTLDQKRDGTPRQRPDPRLRSGKSITLSKPKTEEWAQSGRILQPRTDDARRVSGPERD